MTGKHPSGPNGVEVFPLSRTLRKESRSLKNLLTSIPNENVAKKNLATRGTETWPDIHDPMRYRTKLQSRLGNSIKYFLN
jgi:hypothetical protein